MNLMMIDVLYVFNLIVKYSFLLDKLLPSIS